MTGEGASIQFLNLPQGSFDTVPEGDTSFALLNLQAMGVDSTLLEATSSAHNALYYCGLEATDAAFETRFTEAKQHGLRHLRYVVKVAMGRQGVVGRLRDPSRADFKVPNHVSGWKKMIDNAPNYIEQVSEAHSPDVLASHPVTIAMRHLRLTHAFDNDQVTAPIDPADWEELFPGRAREAVSHHEVAQQLRHQERGDLSKLILDAQFRNVTNLAQLALIGRLTPALNLLGLMGGAKTTSARLLIRVFGDGLFSDDLIAKQTLAASLHERLAHFAAGESHYKTARLLSIFEEGVDAHSKDTKRVLNLF